MMIFIKNKKAWKEFVKSNDDILIVPDIKEYPFHVYIGYNNSVDFYEFKILYKSDLQSMIDKIDSGREF